VQGFFCTASRTVFQVLLVPTGGPLWQNKDTGAWQIPKGLIHPDEAAADAARRETEEELGVTLAGAMEPLTSIRQAGGKYIEAFAVEQDLDPASIVSNEFLLEWPPRSGRQEAFPEIAAARWFTLEAAQEGMLPSQRPLLQALTELLQAKR
jgi:predicted NUDIX family NTP pyrophosphohydrolase